MLQRLQLLLPLQLQQVLVPHHALLDHLHAAVWLPVAVPVEVVAGLELEQV